MIRTGIAIVLCGISIHIYSGDELQQIQQQQAIQLHLQIHHQAVQQAQQYHQQIVQAQLKKTQQGSKNSTSQGKNSK